MVAKLETVLKACMSAKQATLRPEIQLLNTLLACNTENQRRQVWFRRETGNSASAVSLIVSALGPRGKVADERTAVLVVHPGAAGI